MPINEWTVGIAVLVVTLIAVFGLTWFKKVMVGKSTTPKA